MEIVLSIAIAILTTSGIWLILRPRTFQVIIGLSLISYAVNLFIFAMGRLKSGAAAIVDPTIMNEHGEMIVAQYTDPVPQALVLTAIVIGFATTALFIVIMMVSRGLTGSDHVDGREP